MIIAVSDIVQSAFSVPAVSAVESGPGVAAAEGDGSEAGVEEGGLAVSGVAIAFEDGAGSGDQTGDVPVGVLEGINAIDEEGAVVAIAEQAVVDVAQAPDELLLGGAGELGEQLPGTVVVGVGGRAGYRLLNAAVERVVAECCRTAERRESVPGVVGGGKG